MKIADVAAAIHTRLVGDSTLVNTLIGSSSRIAFGTFSKSSDLNGNALVFNITGVRAVDTANKDMEELEIEFTVRVERDGAQGPDAALLVLDRLLALFHRYEPPLTGGVASTHKLTDFIRQSYGPVDVQDPEVYVAYSAIYTGYIQTI